MSDSSPKCILVHSKVKDQEHADKATNHNYRRYDVPNADQQALHPNVEYINTEKRDYWELATERLAEVGITKPRKDAIRIEEILLTASPEFFKRDENGRAEDYSESKWVKDSMTYLINKYGKQNIIGFDLHQDEKSPHIHAMVVPITPDGRLCCKEIFDPKTLRQNQDDYAEAMKDHGLVRGVKHSQAVHQPMQQMYGQQNQTAAELEKEMGKAKPYVPVQVDNPGRVQFNPEEWAAKQSQAVNEKARAQVEAANKRADKAQNLALEYASAKERVRVLQKQLSTSEALKEANQKTQDDLYKRLAGEEKVPRAVLERGNALLDRALSDIHVERIRLEMVRHQVEVAKERFDIPKFAEESDKMRAQEAKNKVLETDLCRYAGGRTRLEELDKQLAKKADEEVRKAQEQAQWEKDAPAREAQRKRDQERQDKLDLANEKAKIEQICGKVVKTETYIITLNGFATAAREHGLQVENPSKGNLILSVPGSKHRFAHQDLQLEGKEFAVVLNGQMKANEDRYDRENGKSNDREKT